MSKKWAILLVAFIVVGNLIPLVQYSAFTLHEDDYLNDYVTHMGVIFREPTIAWGKALVTAKYLSGPAPGDFPYEDLWSDDTAELLYWLCTKLEG